MNKIISSLFILCTSFLLATGQITVNNQDMPIVGNIYTKSTAASVGSIDYTITGANHFWDFSSLVPVSQTADTFVTVMQTPAFYYPSFVLSANQALKQPNINLGLFQMTNVYNFLNNSTSAYNLVGYAAQLNGIPLPLKYDNPDRYYKFPLNYGNIDSSNSHANLNVPGFGYFNEVKKRKNTVDGWGTLVTPYGTFQVLRVKSVIYQKDSLHLDTIPINFPAVVRNITEYKWIAKNQGIPLLEIVETSLGIMPAFTTTITYKDSLRNLGINEKPITISENKINIYPNPAKDKFSIDFKLISPAEIEIGIYDITGSKIKEIIQPYGEKGNYKISIDLNEAKITKGVYFIKFKNGKNISVTKLIVI